MTFWQRLGTTFLDQDGSLAVPEMAAAGAAVVFLARAVLDLLDRSRPFPYAAVVEGIGGVVLALATAQRVRDGLWKADDKDGERR